MANAGHFDVEINVRGLRELAVERKEVRPSVEEYLLPSGKRIRLLAEGRLVNLGAAEGHPAQVMDMSFANQALSAHWLWASRPELERRVYKVPESDRPRDRPAQARGHGHRDRRADAGARGVPGQL